MTGVVVRLAGRPDDVKELLRDLSKIRELMDVSPMKSDYNTPGHVRMYATMGRARQA